MPRDFPTAHPPAQGPARASRRERSSRGRRGLVTLGGLLAPLALVAAPLTPAAATGEMAAPTGEKTPLTLDIATLNPTVLTPTGPLTITGTISNDSEDTWTSINLQPITSSTPMTTSAAVREAADLPADAPVGERVTAPGSFETIDELAPGESQWFSITVDRAHLGIGTAPGVYWVGVHARGTNSQGHDDVTDGRDRMFLPLVTEPAKRAVPATLVVPVRARVARDAVGRVTELDRWQSLLARGGRLHDLFQLQVSETGARVTWLVDPAVLEAVEQIARGNPADPLMTVPADGEEPDENADGEDGSAVPDPTTSATSPQPSASPSATPSVVPIPSTVPEADVTADAELRDLASVWLSRTSAILRNSEVLGLPYGDVDVSGATAAGSDLARRAAVRSTEVFKRLQIDATAAVNSTSGMLRPAALKQLPSGSRALIERAQVSGDEAARDEQAAADAAAEGTDGALDDSPSQLTVDNRPVTVYDTFDGEPDLGDDATTLRQRLLAETAVRRMEGITSPFVVKLPNAWHPTTTADLLAGLNPRWITWQSLAASALGPSRAVGSDALTYPAAVADQEIPASTFATARSTISAAQQLTGIINGTSPLGPLTERSVFTTLSQQQRDRVAADAELKARGTMLTDLLGSVTIQAPKRVLLSSTSGQFPGTVANGLTVPVTVRVRATTDDTLELSDPGTLEIAPKGQVDVRFGAESSKLGMHQVQLAVTDTDGEPTGSKADLPLRSASVSVIVWWAMAAGAAVLVLMILRQWRRRGLRRRADPLPDPDEDRPVAAEQPSADPEESAADPTGAER